MYLKDFFLKWEEIMFLKLIAIKRVCVCQDQAKQGFEPLLSSVLSAKLMQYAMNRREKINAPTLPRVKPLFIVLHQ